MSERLKDSSAGRKDLCEKKIASASRKMNVKRKKLHSVSNVNNSITVFFFLSIYFILVNKIKTHDVK